MGEDKCCFRQGTDIKEITLLRFHFDLNTSNHYTQILHILICVIHISRITHFPAHTDNSHTKPQLPCQVFVNGGHGRLCGTVRSSKGTELASRYPGDPLDAKTNRKDHQFLTFKSHR